MEVFAPSYHAPLERQLSPVRGIRSLQGTYLGANGVDDAMSLRAQLAAAR